MKIKKIMSSKKYNSKELFEVDGWTLKKSPFKKIAETLQDSSHNPFDGEVKLRTSYYEWVPFRIKEWLGGPYNKFKSNLWKGHDEHQIVLFQDSLDFAIDSITFEPLFRDADFVYDADIDTTYITWDDLSKGSGSSSDRYRGYLTLEVNGNLFEEKREVKQLNMSDLENFVKYQANPEYVGSPSHLFEDGDIIDFHITQHGEHLDVYIEFNTGKGSSVHEISRDYEHFWKTYTWEENRNYGLSMRNWKDKAVMQIRASIYDYCKEQHFFPQYLTIHTHQELD